MTVTLDKLRAAAEMDSSGFQSALDARMTPPQRREDETMEAYVIRLIRGEERERCAKIAETFDMDGSLGKLPKGWAGCRRMIAAAIRKAE